ncbi:hypothetical protein AM493_04115 [Flavobacterium akiainvivens]|uniref:Cyclic nucleotide-binding domain-containing protein n=1 Tax=Flavobacterium akiainvivens TaxID=1202724 RepID=A0A0N0RQG5_9FLAO|nr:Crp/Fnr family transcriptional regulator [Flavobacterium akiainvivens]KOS05306.1 hypothetical protein AM493_04115 [Flavobacterium akiainvivens]SFQ76317.1 cAMP-binding domain of CRP or a regulatory subunit of cAMP-dependent protein kinases [Flavobacterium akiainvivens]
MKDILEFINQISSLSIDANEDFLEALEIKTYPKGTFILKADQVCRNYYFIKSGLTKSHFYKEEKEFIMTFFKEKMMFTEISSYLTEKPSRYMITALEETTVCCISKKDVMELCKKHHPIEALFSKMFSFATLNMMKRISEMLEENGTDRYNNFIRENNELLQRISLGDLANYLGITQVTLSRIRAAK